MQVCRDYLEGKEPRDRTACLEKMVSPVHLAHPEEREREVQQDWMDCRVCQVQRETRATARQADKDPKETRAAMVCRASKARVDFPAKTAFPASTARKEMADFQDCRDKRENQDCRASRELRANPEEAV